MKRFLLALLVVLPLTLSAAVAPTVKSFSWSMPTATLDGTPLLDSLGQPVPGAPVIAGTRIYCSGAIVVDVPAPALTIAFPVNMDTFAADGSFTTCVASVYDTSGAEGLRSSPVTVANVGGKFYPGNTLAAPGSFVLSVI